MGIVTDLAQLEAAPHQLFQVVQAVAPWRDYWTIEGIFTKAEDAAVFMAEVAKRPGWNDELVDRMPMEAIVEQLIKERFHQLGPLIKKLLG